MERAGDKLQPIWAVHGWFGSGVCGEMSAVGESGRRGEEDGGGKEVMAINDGESPRETRANLRERIGSSISPTQIRRPVIISRPSLDPGAEYMIQ